MKHSTIVSYFYHRPSMVLHNKFVNKVDSKSSPASLRRSLVTPIDVPLILVDSGRLTGPRTHPVYHTLSSPDVLPSTDSALTSPPSKSDKPPSGCISQNSGDTAKGSESKSSRTRKKRRTTDKQSVRQTNLRTNNVNNSAIDGGSHAHSTELSRKTSTAPHIV